MQQVLEGYVQKIRLLQTDVLCLIKSFQLKQVGGTTE